MSQVKAGNLVMVATVQGSRYDGKIGIVLVDIPLAEYSGTQFQLSVLIEDEILGFGYDEVRIYKEIEKIEE